MQITGAVRRPDGARIRFQVQGPRGAAPVLLLQGQANSHGWWDPLRPDFTSEFLTLTMDYRGTGQSSAATRTEYISAQWSTLAFAHDVAAVLQGTGLGPAHVYATSMRGRVAQHLAAEYPDAVRSLVLACTSPGHGIGIERDADVRRSLATGTSAERRRAMIDLFYTPSWVKAHGGYTTVPSALLGDPTMTPEARAGHLATSNTHDGSRALAHIHAPTLVLHGAADRMVPVANADIIGARLPSAEVRIVPDGRHGFFHEMSDIVTPAVKRHFARHT